MPDLAPPSSPFATLIRPGAMAESRDRWRDLALLGATLVFETDARQLLVLVEPAVAFGWNTETLLGRPLSALFAPDHAREEAPPTDRGLRDRRTWLRRPDGSRAAVTLSTTPLRGGGLRGAVQDRDEPERERRRLAAALSRRQVVRDVAGRMRQPVLPDTMLRIGLNEIIDLMGAEGAMLLSGCLDPVAFRSDGAASTAPGASAAGGSGSGATAGIENPPVTLPRILHRAGMALSVPDGDAIAALSRIDAGETELFGRAILSAAIDNHFSPPVLLALWRDARRPWLDDDGELVHELGMLLGNVLDHEQVQREFTRQSGTDILTGLLTRDSFRAEAARRLERVSTEGASTSLMVIGLDDFAAINDRHGFESGDAVLRGMARCLRDTFRPTDLVARLHGDVFGVWLAGADQFAAAERAEALCQSGLTVSAVPAAGTIQLSIGMSVCAGRAVAAVDAALEQAGAALHAIRLAGGGRWHVYNEDTVA